MTKCFVIGAIGEAGSPIREAADDFMKYIVTPVVTSQEFGYERPIRADSLNEPWRITTQIIKLLMDADLVIADLTGNNANVFYELSLRHAIGKPVVHMAHEGTPLSFDVRDNRTIFYTMHSRTAEAARSELAQQIRHVRQPAYRPLNPILETTSILSSEFPEQKVLGKVMEMIEQVSSAVLEIQQQMRTQAVRSRASITNSLPVMGLLNSTDEDHWLNLAKLGGSSMTSALARALAVDPDKSPVNSVSATLPSEQTNDPKK